MPYGSATYTAHINSVETPFQWLGGCGVYYDNETDLHLTLHRAYSSKLKRFISPDPLGIDAFANIYAYGDLNPLAFVDPEGLATYKLNSQLGVTGKVRPSYSLFSHTLEYTTYPDGSLENTYSWAPNAGAMFWEGDGGNWEINAEVDRKAALEDIASGQKHSQLISIYEEYDEALDAEIKRRMESGEDAHFWWPWDQCKTEMKEVDRAIAEKLFPDPGPIDSNISKNRCESVSIPK